MSAPSMPQGSLPPDENLGPNILASLWTPFPFTVLFLVARFYVRCVRHNVGLDDWLMLIGWVIYTGALSIDTAVARLGGFRHEIYIPPENILLILKLEIITQPFGIFCLAFVKSSVAVLLPRLLTKTSTWRVRFLYANVVIYFAITIATTGVIFGQCSPSSASWSPALLASGQAKCLPPTVNLGLSVLHGAFGAYLDFLLALMPVTIIWGLNLPRSKRIGLCVLLGLGVFAGVCAIIKTIEIVNYQTATDPTWQSYALNLWAGLEAPFVIIAGSAGAAKPLWDSWLQGQRLSRGKHDQFLPNEQSFWNSLKGGLLRKSSPRHTAASSGNPAGVSGGNQAAQHSRDAIMMVRTVDVESHSIQSGEDAPSHPYTVFGKP